MKIPKKVIKDNREYEFVAVVNNNMFLYEDTKIKARTTFSRFDLGMIDNEKIDKMLNSENEKTVNGLSVIVYDRLFEKETKYNSISEASEVLGIPRTTLTHKIKNKEWLFNRWFVERVE